MKTEDCRPIYKTPLKSKSGKTTEWSTLDDLQRIEPIQRKIQSFLVQLRISSSNCWEDVHQHFIGNFLEFLRVELSSDGSFSDILDLTCLVLDTILLSQRPHEKSVQESVCQIVAQLLSQFDCLRDDKENFNFENLIKLVDLVLVTDPSQLANTTEFNNPLLKIRPVIDFDLEKVIRLLSTFSAEMITEEARISLVQLVHRDDRDEYGTNLFLKACSFHELFTISFLVQFGANVNARDNEGNGILHILSYQRETFPSGNETRDATGRLLIELGAHLDMVNKAGMTAADIWFQRNTPGKRDVTDLPDWLQEGVPSLKCLCSRVIRRHKIPYEDGDTLPVKLIPFVSLH